MLHIFCFAGDRFILGLGAKSKCVIDTQNHLMWDKSPSSVRYTWDKANIYVKGLNLCGYTDWRLPTKEEQITLQRDATTVSYAPFAWLNTHGFSNIQTEFYWSSESYTLDEKDAWGFYMYSGKVYNESKTHKNYVWPVRDYAN